MPGWLQLILAVIMGVGMAGVGMNVMHDGNHGAFSNKEWVKNDPTKINTSIKAINDLNILFLKIETIMDVYGTFTMNVYRWSTDKDYSQNAVFVNKTKIT